MTTAPPGWLHVSLGDCVRLIAGVGFPKRLQGQEGGEIPVYKVGDISRLVVKGNRFLQESPNTLTLRQAQRLASALVPGGATAFAKIGAAIALNRRAITTRPCLVDNNVFAVVPAEGFLHSLFLYYFLRTVRLEEFSRATTVPSLRKGDVENIEFPLAPLPEQERVVVELDSYFSRLDAAEENLKRTESNLKRYRASVLKAAVEGRLVPTEAELAKHEGREYEPAPVLLERILKERRHRWEEAELTKMEAKGKVPKNDSWKAKYKEPISPDLAELPELPEGWGWATVDQLGLVASGQTPKGVDNQSCVDGSVPWYRVGDMNLRGNESTMTKSTVRLTAKSITSLGLAVRPEGTIVFPKRGGAINTNKKRRLGIPAAYDLNTMGVVPAPSGADYLWIWFLGLDLAKLADGSNVPQINHGDIRPLAVPLPPEYEQRRIAAELERLLDLTNKVRGEILRNVIRAKRLRQSILKWAFEGKLVDQDPNDEPASVLLERIRKARQSKQHGQGRKPGRQLDLGI